VSVLQGFLQNLAYGEMATEFTDVSGLPGYCQKAFTPENAKSNVNKGKFIGAFAAWCYWFGWTPIMAIFTMMIGDYLTQMFDWSLDGWSTLMLYMVVGFCVVAMMLYLGFRGLEGGAKAGLVMALLSIIPMVIIIAGAYIAGMFDFSLISDNMLKPGWTWSPTDIVMLLGCVCLAQWSGTAWETAAVYGPEYKNPKKDLPKALFSCGFICLALYFLLPFTVYGSLGQSGIEDAGYATLVPIAEYVFGTIGSYLALGLLIVAMLLIVQTSFLGSSRTLYYMSLNKNMPSFLGKTNKNGMPHAAMIFVTVFNLFLIFIVGLSNAMGSDQTVMTILSASAFAYTLMHGITLSAYVKIKLDPRFKGAERPFKAPRGWVYVAGVMAFLEFFVLFPCLGYWSYVISGNSILPMMLAGVVLLIFVPIWYCQQKKNDREESSNIQDCQNETNSLN